MCIDIKTSYWDGLKTFVVEMLWWIYIYEWTQMLLVSFVCYSSCPAENLGSLWLVAHFCPEATKQNVSGLVACDTFCDGYVIIVPGTPKLLITQMKYFCGWITEWNTVEQNTHCRLLFVKNIRVTVCHSKPHGCETFLATFSLQDTKKKSFIPLHWQSFCTESGFPWSPPSLIPRTTWLYLRNSVAAVR